MDDPSHTIYQLPSDGIPAKQLPPTPNLDNQIQKKQAKKQLYKDDWTFSAMVGATANNFDYTQRSPSTNKSSYAQTVRGILHVPLGRLEFHTSLGLDLNSHEHIKGGYKFENDPDEAFNEVTTLDAKASLGYRFNNIAPLWDLSLRVGVYYLSAIEHSSAYNFSDQLAPLIGMHWIKQLNPALFLLELNYAHLNKDKFEQESDVSGSKKFTSGVYKLDGYYYQIGAGYLSPLSKYFNISYWFKYSQARFEDSNQIYKLSKGGFYIGFGI